MPFHVAPSFPILVLSAVVLAKGALSVRNGKAAEIPTFPEFIEQFGRSYKPGDAEYAGRRALFEQRVAEIASQNAAGDAWRAAVNKFADRTDEELAKLRGWRSAKRRGRSLRAPAPASLMRFSETKLPAEMDWRSLQAMQAIQDQGGCGSCWAFAAATVLRAHSEIYQEDRQFSVQQIVSCTPNERQCGGTGGCSGATAELAMEYVMQNGCVPEDEFPYKEADVSCPAHMAPTGPFTASFMNLGVSRDASKGGEGFGMMGWTRLPENKMEPVQRALVEWGPVAVSVSAGYSWNAYWDGILTSCIKDAIIDHAVTLVGFGEDDDVKFWRLQNSWGRDWGEDGFVRIARHDDEDTEQCGWDNQPDMGSGCKGGPDKVKVCGTCGILYDAVVPHFSGDGWGARLMAAQRHQVVLLSSANETEIPASPPHRHHLGRRMTETPA